MEKSKVPSKEAVRQWMVERRARRFPLPDLALIRLQLDWSRQSAAEVQERLAAR